MLSFIYEALFPGHIKISLGIKLDDFFLTLVWLQSTLFKCFVCSIITKNLWSCLEDKCGSTCL